MQSDQSQFALRPAPGWREYQGARVCLIDVETTFASLYRAYFDEVGASADYFLYLAGLRAAAVWARAFDARADSSAFQKSLDKLGDRGFGWFRSHLPDAPEGCIRVIAEHSMEAWGLTRARLRTGRTACNYTAGLLAGLWSFAAGAAGSADDIACWETACTAAGASECAFEIGPENRLRDRGLADPWKERGLRWQMQDLSLKLHLSSDRLSNVERTLADRQQAYQSLLDNMNDVLLVLDSEKRVVFANKVFLDNGQMTLDQAVGRSPLDWIHADDRVVVESAYDDLLSGRSLQATYKFRVRRGQNLVFVESSARRIRGPNGVTLIESIGRDITEREQTRQRLESALAELTHKQQAADNDLRIAKSVHESLLPGAVSRAEIELDVKYRPVDRVGGDYCHVHFPEDRFCLLTVCDVSGHGVASALMASRVSSFLQAQARRPQDPLQLTGDLNAFLRRYFSETGLFVTFFAIAIDLETFEVRHCGAGHPAPLVWRRSTGAIESLESQNLPVGILDQFLRQTASDKTQLEPGDRILVYTDGVTETVNERSEQLGAAGLTRLFAESTALPILEVGDWLLAQVARYAAGRPHDDMTIVILEAKRPRHDPSG